MIRTPKRACAPAFFAAAATLFTLLIPPGAHAQSPAPFTFSDVSFWVGSGTNSAVILIDFDAVGQAKGLTKSLAWGYRWNGVKTRYEALEAIVAEDRRLHWDCPKSSFGIFLNGLAYDFGNNGGAFDFANGTATDADGVLAPGYNLMFGFFWDWYITVLENSGAYTGAGEGFVNTNDGIDWPINPGSFVGFKYCPWADENYNMFFDEITWEPLFDCVPAQPTFAESPYGWRVAAHAIGNSAHNNLDSVLGRPTTIDDANNNSSMVPVTPFVPAMSRSSVLALADHRANSFSPWQRGTVTIEFDHPVVDHPKNPWGLDFIVFGNSWYQALPDDSPGTLHGKEDPANVSILDNIFSEPGLVEISQDGVAWYGFQNGPFADDFAPTLGYRFDPANADTNLFAGNLWWSVPTDPTYPVPPGASDFIGIGTNLETIVKYYGKSAGGTAFDIGSARNSGNNPIPATGPGNRKWFKFVRITSLSAAGDFCDIDAVSAVYPDSAWELWQKDNFNWAQLSAPGVSGKTALSPNGNGNYLNFALGAGKSSLPAPEPRISDFAIRDGRLHFTFSVWKPDWSPRDMAESGVGFGLKFVNDLATPWSDALDYYPPVLETVAPNVAPVAPWQGPHSATVSVPTYPFDEMFFRLSVTAED